MVDKRPCLKFLIGSSVGSPNADTVLQVIKALFNVPAFLVGKLVQFLRMSFHGGTDAVPVLKHSLELLSEKEWKNADVLMISDFVMQSLDNDIKAQIESAQENNTNFHSLVIGTSGNNGAINGFNHNWFYDANTPQANRHLVEQIHEIRLHNSVLANFQ